MEKGAPGYRGRLHEMLNSRGIAVGDVVRITREDRIFQGMLMPRPELSDDSHLVIKLSNGYNIGIRVDSSVSLEREGDARRS